MSEKKVPKLRFPEFSGEWEENKLGDMCEFTQGIQIPSSEQFTEYRKDYIRYLYIRDFFSDDFICFVKNAYPNKIIHEYEIMMVNTGNTSGQAYMGKRGVLSNNSFKISFNQAQLNNRFLFEFLGSSKTQNIIKSNFNSGGQPHLGHNNIAKIKITFPTLEEQTKIADFLTSVDDKIQQLAKKKELLEQYKNGVTQQIFSQQIRFKDDNGNDYPDWDFSLFSDIATFSKGKGISKSDINENGMFDCIRYGELYTHYNEVIKEVFSRTNIDKSLLVFSDENDIIIPASGETQIDIAKASCILKKNVALGGDLNIIKSSLNGIYLSYYLNTVKRLEIASLAQGNSVVHLYASQLQTLEVTYPSIAEQIKIADFLTSIDDKITQVNIQLEQTKLFKKSLLQQLFI